MSKYLLLLYDDPADIENLTPEQMQELVQAYSRWAREMAEAGKLVSGEKLADHDHGRVIRRPEPRGGDERGTPVVADGPFIETREVLGGFFIVNANSYEEAVEIAKSCPHATGGAVIHIRHIEETQ